MKWTKQEITEFDELVEAVSSKSQMARIHGRLDMNAFLLLHGKDKCDAMHAHLEAGGNKADFDDGAAEVNP